MTLSIRPRERTHPLGNRSSGDLSSPRGKVVQRRRLIGVRDVGLLDGARVVGRGRDSPRSVGTTAPTRSARARHIACTIRCPASTRLAASTVPTIGHTKQRSQAAATRARGEKTQTKRKSRESLHDSTFRVRGEHAGWGQLRKPCSLLGSRRESLSE